jgi:hypothetical protein
MTSNGGSYDPLVACDPTGCCAAYRRLQCAKRAFLSRSTECRSGGTGDCAIGRPASDITVTSSPDGPRYSAIASDGRTIVANATLEQLRAEHPELYKFVNPNVITDAEVHPQDSRIYSGPDFVDPTVFPNIDQKIWFPGAESLVEIKIDPGSVHSITSFDPQLDATPFRRDADTSLLFDASE